MHSRHIFIKTEQPSLDIKYFLHALHSDDLVQQQFC